MFICFWFSCPGTIKYNNWSHWLFHNPIKEVILKKNNGKEKDLPPRIHVYKINYKINFNYQFEVFFFLIFLFVPLLPKFRRTYLLLLNILFSLKLLGWNLYHSKKKWLSQEFAIILCFCLKPINFSFTICDIILKHQFIRPPSPYKSYWQLPERMQLLVLNSRSSNIVLKSIFIY